MIYQRLAVTVGDKGLGRIVPNPLEKTLFDRSELTAWWRADINMRGATKTWRSRKNGHTLTMPGAQTFPTFSATSGPAGKPAATWPGTGAVFVSQEGQGFYPIANRDYTIAYVAKSPATANPSRVVINNGMTLLTESLGVIPGMAWIGQINTNNSMQASHRTGSNPTTTNPTSIATSTVDFHLVMESYRSYSTPQGALWIDGVERDRDNFSASFMPAKDQLVVGGAYDGAVLQLPATGLVLSDVFVFNGALAEPEYDDVRAALHAYVDDRYGLL